METLRSESIQTENNNFFGKFRATQFSYLEIKDILFARENTA